MNNKKKGNIFIISAPSGAGKSTICKKLLKNMANIEFSVSATTRKPRPDETDGIEYYFVSKNEFKEMIEKDLLLEWAEVHNNFYGTPIKPVLEKTENSTDIILDLDVQGGMQIKEKLPEAILIFISPPSFEVLEKRLRGRATDSDEVISIRLKNAKTEMKYKNEYKHHIINDDLEKATSDLKKIISSYRILIK